MFQQQSVPTQVAADGLPPVCISLFGKFELVVNGVPVTSFRSNKTRALLAYLLIAPSQPLRTAISDLLWPDYAATSARANLRQTIANLRNCLAPFDLLQSNRTHLSLTQDANLFWCDVHQFEALLDACQQHEHHSLAGCAVCRTRLQQAVALHQEPLLEHFPAIDSPPFQEWLASQRTRLAARLAEAQAALAAGDAPPGNLPPPLTPLVGRAQELVVLKRYLHHTVYRCVTLIGPGGIGKTRLACALGAQVQPQFPDGVWLVELSELAPTTPDEAAKQGQERLAMAIGQTLNFAFCGTQPPTKQVAHYLADKTTLLILDSFEHLTTGAAWLPTLLTAAPSVQILITTRHRLPLQSQLVYPVEGLGVPPAEILDSYSATHLLPQYTSIQLFTERAESAGQILTLDETTLITVGQICRFVEGSPWAIELAAAVLHHQSPAVMLAAIQHNYRALATDLLDVPLRQRSAEAVFRTAWALLTATEAQTLARCAVFRGGFTPAASQAIGDVSAADLQALVHKSLLHPVGAERFTLHELVRQFAAEQLAQRGADQQAVAARHAAYYIALLQAQETALLTHADAQVIIQRELDNLRVAWQWSVAQGELALLAQGATSLFTFYRLAGLYHEALQRLESAIARLRQLHAATPADPAPRHLLARLLSYAADFYRRTGAIAAGARMAEEALALGQGLADPAVQAFAYHQLARLAQVHNNFPAMQRWAEAGCTQARLAQRSDLLSECLNDLAIPLTFQQQPMAGAPYFEEALQTVAGVANPYLEAQILANLGRIRMLSKEYELARRYLQRASRLHQILRDQEYKLLTHLMLGDLWMAIGFYSAAQQEYAQAQPMLKVTANPYWISWLQICSGYLLHLCGDSAAARAGLTLGRQTAKQGGNRLFESCALSYLGYVLIDGEAWEAAQACFQQSLALQSAAPWMMGTADVQAGLAACFLTQGETTAAILHVERALHLLTQHGVDAANELFLVYWLCFQVLQTVADGRALEVLRTAYERLQACAAQFEDPALRHAFLNDVAVNRRLVTAAEAAGLHAVLYRNSS